MYSQPNFILPEHVELISVTLFIHFKLLVDHFCGVVAYSPGRISGGGGPNMDSLNIPNTEMTHQTSSSKFDFNHYKGMLKQPILISMNMEISPIHHGVVLGKVGPKYMIENLSFALIRSTLFDFFHDIKLIILG